MEAVCVAELKKERIESTGISLRTGPSGMTVIGAKIRKTQNMYVQLKAKRQRPFATNHANN